MTGKEQRIALLRKSARRFREIATDHSTPSSRELIELAEWRERRADGLERGEAVRLSAEGGRDRPVQLLDLADRQREILLERVE